MTLAADDEALVLHVVAEKTAEQIEAEVGGEATEAAEAPAAEAEAAEPRGRVRRVTGAPSPIGAETMWKASRPCGGAPFACRAGRQWSER